MFMVYGSCYPKKLQTIPQLIFDIITEQEKTSMKELIKHIAQTLVDTPDQVDVQEIIAQQTLVLELRVAKEDLGKVIGKSGKTAQAMRTILSCAAAKEQKRVILEIVE